jgi:hypothetical protein
MVTLKLKELVHWQSQTLSWYSAIYYKISREQLGGISNSVPLPNFCLHGMLRDELYVHLLNVCLRCAKLQGVIL